MEPAPTERRENNALLSVPVKPDRKGLATHLRVESRVDLWCELPVICLKASTYTIDPRSIPTSPFATSTVPCVGSGVSILPNVPPHSQDVDSWKHGAETVRKAASPDFVLWSQKDNFCLEILAIMFRNGVLPARAECVSSTHTPRRPRRDRDSVHMNDQPRRRQDRVPRTGCSSRSDRDQRTPARGLPELMRAARQRQNYCGVEVGQGASVRPAEADLTSWKSFQKLPRRSKTAGASREGRPAFLLGIRRCHSASPPNRGRNPFAA
jgi:hypothetical protein